MDALLSKINDLGELPKEGLTKPGQFIFELFSDIALDADVASSLISLMERFSTQFYGI